MRQQLEFTIAGTALKRPSKFHDLLEYSGGLESFADPRARTVMRLMGERLKADLPVDCVSLNMALDPEELRKIGGPNSLFEISQYDVVSADSHASELLEVALTSDGERALAGLQYRFQDDPDLIGKFDAAIDTFNRLKQRALNAGGAAGPTEACWSFTDLTSVLDGTYTPVMPTVGAREDGVGLFYPGRLNDVSGESEGGKTWLALIACLVEINRRNHVVYLDFEDDAGGVVSRLLLLGAQRESIAQYFHYVRPDIAPGKGDIEVFLRLVSAAGPTLVILDGVTEAMAMFGLELKENTDVAAFGQKLLRPLAATGAAVVTLDHVVKNSENRGRYSLGGAHKLNGINGVKYIVEAVHPFGVGLTGRSRVRIAKDRPAQLRKHALPSGERLHWFADLVVESYGNAGAMGHLYPAVAKVADPNAMTAEELAKADEMKTLKAAVLAALRKADEPLSTTGVQDRVTGRGTAVRRALVALVDEGVVSVEKGTRGSVLHRLATPSDGSAK
jgi:hypothetical protein